MQYIWDVRRTTDWLVSGSNPAIQFHNFHQLRENKPSCSANLCAQTVIFPFFSAHQWPTERDAWFMIIRFNLEWQQFSKGRWRCHSCLNMSAGSGIVGEFLFSVELVKVVRTQGLAHLSPMTLPCVRIGLEPLTSQSVVRFAYHCFTAPRQFRQIIQKFTILYAIACNNKTIKSKIRLFKGYLTAFD